MSYWRFDDRKYNGAGSNIDEMMHTISNGGHSAAALILADLVATRMRGQEQKSDKFNGEDIPVSSFLEELDDPLANTLHEMALSMKLTHMPKELLMLVLPLLLHVDTQSPNPDDIHALHAFIKASNTHKDTVKKWMREEPAKSTLERAFKPTMNYATFKEAYESKDTIARFNSSQTDLQLKQTDSYAYQFVQTCECTDCLKTAVELRLIDFQQYGQNGKSLLHAAIESGHHESMAYALDNLMGRDLDPRHLPTSIDGMSIPHHVALLHDQNLFRKVVETLTRSGYPLSVWNDDGLKLELCSFVNAELAEWLLSKGFNIAKLPRNTLPKRLPSRKDKSNQNPPFANEWNHDAEYGDPIVRSEPLDMDRFDASSVQFDGVGISASETRPTSRTVWHRAIENPQGAGIMDWLSDHTYVQPGCKSDFDRETGETALVLAAKGNEPAGIEWLCQNTESTAPRSRNLTNQAESTHAYAMQTAAHSVQPSSAAILYVISNYAPRELFEDLELVKNFFWLVIKGYSDAHLQLEETMAAGQDRRHLMTLLRNITRSKIKVLNTRLHGEWDGWFNSEHLKWLLQYCTIMGFNFILGDLKSGISFSLNWEKVADMKRNQVV